MEHGEGPMMKIGLVAGPKTHSPHQRMARGKIGKEAEIATCGDQFGTSAPSPTTLLGTVHLYFFWMEPVAQKTTSPGWKTSESPVADVPHNRHVNFSFHSTLPQARAGEALSSLAPQISRSTSLWPSLWVTALHPLLEWPAFFYGLTESFVNERLIRFPDPA